MEAGNRAGACMKAFFELGKEKKPSRSVWKLP
jgi:hypothetical protein